MFTEFPEWNTFEAWVLKISAVFAAFAALYTIIKKLYVAIKEVITISSKINSLLEIIQPNGGTSLIDTINRIESKITKSEQRERAILQETPIPMFETNNHGECTWINKSYQVMSGKSVEEISGNGWQTTISEIDRKRVSDEWESAIKNQRDFDLSYIMKNTDKATEFKVSCRAYIQKNKSGEVIGWFGIIKKMSSHFD